MQGDIINIKGLSKRFKKFTAVDNVTFSVKKGELFGLLGPNGAGKTTTINMLSTLLKPTSGTASISGFDVNKDRDDVRRSIGIVFQEPALDGKLTGAENLQFHAMMYGLKKKDWEPRIKEVMGLVELSDKAKELVENYSGGMKRRLEIARGFVHRPKVLFLDEPTLGLDAQTRRHIWDYIRMLNQTQGMTIILTTHYMEEADALCGRIAIMDKGKIIALDTPEALKDSLGGDIVSLDIDKGATKLARALKDKAWVRKVKRDDCCLRLTVKSGGRHIPEMMDAARDNGIAINSVDLHKPSLEDVFISLTGKTLRDEEASRQEKMRSHHHGGRGGR